MRKEREEEAEWARKEEASHSKKEATKDMVSRWSDRGQECSKDVHLWRR
jgi:hypothetical protein